MILVKTEVGQSVLKDRSIALSPKQRAAFILFDGKKSLNQVLEQTAAMAVSVQDIEYLMGLGLLAKVAEPEQAEPSFKGSRSFQATVPFNPAQPPPRPVSTGQAGSVNESDAQRFQDAYKIATQLTSGLGLRGFRLNMAVEGAQGLAGLKELAPKILAAVGEKAFLPLEQALYR